MVEPLDIEQADQLLAYLRRTARIAADEMPRITKLAGGVSNRTVLVERLGGESWVLKQALAKLRTQAEWFSDPARVHREALGIRWLSQLAPPGTITPLIFEDFDHHLIAMQAVPQPHENWKSMLLAGDLRAEHFAQFGRLLGTIHHNSMDRASELEQVFRDTSFFESLRIEPYYRYTAQTVPDAAWFLEDLARETRNHRIALVHGDYSPKNILVRSDQMILLDHEVIHWGDPAFDVGFALAHLLSKARHLPEHRMNLASGADSFFREYRTRNPSIRELHVVWHTLACMLARVAGRSTLEYLNGQERVAQQKEVLRMLDFRPSKVVQLIAEVLFLS